MTAPIARPGMAQPGFTQPGDPGQATTPAPLTLQMPNKVVIQVFRAGNSR